MSFGMHESLTKAVRAIPLSLLSLCLIGCGDDSLGSERGRFADLSYPEAPRGDHVDLYHGTSVPDPYRWMNDLDDVQTKEWMAAQESLTASYFDGTGTKAKLRTRIDQENVRGRRP